MDMRGPTSFSMAVMEAQQHLQDALRASMSAQQQQQQQQQPQQPQGMPQMPQGMQMQGMPQMPPEMQGMQMPQEMQGMQMPQEMQMPQGLQGLPQEMQSQLGSAMGSPQMGAPAQFARGGLAVKKAAGGAAGREKPFWEKTAPKTASGKKRKPKSLSAKQKSSAKRRAKAAGRPYPNLVDNAFAVKKGK